METKNLAGFATIALVAAVPAFAQMSPAQTPPPGTSSQDNGLYGSQVNPPQVSSPAEKQETQQLNAQAIDGTTQSPTVLNGEAPATHAPTPLDGPQSSDAAQSGQSAQYAQQQYQEQQDQYQQQQQQYQDEQGQYDDQHRRYEHNVWRYDRAQWSYDYPAVYDYRYDDSVHLRPLYMIDEPVQRLADVPVEGPSGVWVGRIRNVETGPDGRPIRVEIGLNRRVAVWVDPGDLRFDVADHVAFTHMTRDELWDMPGTAVVEPVG
jgi:hypothetical protein